MVDPRRRPWWIPPVFGPIPEGVEPEHLRLLGFIIFAMLFENYDLALIGAALPQIAGEFGLSNPDKGTFMSWIELGALASFLLIPLADRYGRRWLLLACVGAMSIGSLATAFAPTGPAFVVCQMLTRSFATTATVISLVIVAEEFPAAHRGWGIGMLGAMGAIGFGLGAAVYSQVQVLPYGWRAVYACGGLAIVFLPYFRKHIRETERFRRERARRGASDASWLSALRPVWELARRFPGRATLLGAAAALLWMGHRPATRFDSDYLQTARGWSPEDYAVLTIVGGAIALLASPQAGRLGDRIGRGRLAAMLTLVFPITAGLFYQGASALAPFVWVGMVFTATATVILVRTLAGELFPTEMRSSAGGWILLIEVVGATAGLLLYSAIEARIDEWGLAIGTISAISLGGGLLLLFLPATHRRELEEISHEIPVASR